MITIHFIANNDPKALGSATISSKTGRSLMQAAQSGGVDGIAADCGGSLTCATCHVMVREPWASQLPPPGADELAMLEFTAECCASRTAACRARSSSPTRLTA
jgi:2Fe-2S ferredoxin